MTIQSLAEVVCLAFAASGTFYVALTAITAAIFAQRMKHPPCSGSLPPITILKPLYGADKNLLENLRAACSLDYPEYQVVLSAQRSDDPAIPIMRQILKEFGSERVTLAVVEGEPCANGKIQNLEIALPHARHDVIVISDSDIKLAPDYLRVIAAPLDDPKIGCVCTPYRAIDARHWFEKLELLTMNADFVPNLVFTAVSGLLTFGLGASMCVRRADLEAIGGFAAFRDTLAEDCIMAEGIAALGKRVVLAPYFVDMEVDLKSYGQWWSHQLYWDQNVRVIRPGGYFATIAIRAIPFALLFALLSGFDDTSLSVLAVTLGVRLVSAAYVLTRLLRDREGMSVLWLLPVRDVMGLAIWIAAMLKRDFIRRGRRFALQADGRIVPRSA